MKSKALMTFCILSVCALLCCAKPSFAQNAPQAPKSKSEAAKKAQQKVNGRVLKVDQNRSKYRVKVLQKSGRVISVDVDKKSGKVSQKKKKD
ncbi:PepSY domain-containing protein [Paraglaciecola aestuariivivens]